MTRTHTNTILDDSETYRACIHKQPHRACIHKHSYCYNTLIYSSDINKNRIFLSGRNASLPVIGFMSHTSPGSFVIKKEDAGMYTEIYFLELFRDVQLSLSTGTVPVK
jgi:hypothetical protein